jgi:hypothetical protein
MMQDVDRVLAEVASHAKTAGLDLESVREVLVAQMLCNQPLPIDYRGRPTIKPEDAPARSARSNCSALQFKLGT